MKPPDDVPHEDEADVSRETRHIADTVGYEVQLAELFSEFGEGRGNAETDRQLNQLARYGRWLQEEAIAAGGLGPAEGPRIFDRHLADSLMYLRGLDDPRASIVDVGSGVGLPGIPLAIARPSAHVTMLDRSARRTRLAQRAVRILRLDNVDVVTADVGQWAQHAAGDRFNVAVFRASLPIAEAAEAFRAVTRPQGLGLVGVSRRPGAPDIPQPPAGVDFSLTAEESPVLDSPFWLLRMRTT